MAELVCSQKPFTLRLTTDYKSNGDFYFSPYFPVHTRTQPHVIPQYRIPKFTHFSQRRKLTFLCHCLARSLPPPSLLPSSTDEGITDPPQKEKKTCAKRATTKKGKPTTEKAPARETDDKENTPKKPRTPCKKTCDKLAKWENNSNDPTCKVEIDKSLDDDENDKKAKNYANCVRSGCITKSNALKKPRVARKKQSDMLVERDDNSDDATTKVGENEEDESFDDYSDRKAKNCTNRVRSGRIPKSTLHNKFALKVEKLSIGAATLLELLEAIRDNEVDRIPWLFTRKELNARIALYEEILGKLEEVLGEDEDEDEQAFSVESIQDEEDISEEESFANVN
ncbi:hypothetical protein FN846DRAFT_887510 [Sphaerosporella brunnea]|uniref:Uncharacterized protein n=1 Tax=Sphaerosporella brunnea TaxID=1250544 RepID=A0A5J5F6B1_9PEZI|nr:hypothetical protein FN846DRAFT_887510 [Sphaerosporella brunnea]